MLDEKIVDLLEKRQTDIKEHLRTLFNLVVNNHYKVVVELGAGQSTYVLTAAVLLTKGNFFSIDREIDANFRGYSEGKGILYEHSCYHYIQKDDLEAGKTWEILIDFLFIDSDHDYQHVLDTLRLWASKVRKGGTIAMHDTDHTFGHATGVRPALDLYLKENPGLYSVQHIEGGGGLSILIKERDL